MKKIIGAVITLVIGGTVYTFSQSDVAKNFAKNTGLSQQEAEQYVSNIKDEDLVAFSKIGSDFISDGQDIIKTANDIDCVNYTYEWESSTLTCNEGKSQLTRIGNSEVTLGKSYQKLDTEDATENDISLTIKNIDRLNADFGLGIVAKILDPSTIDEMKKTNSYNRALLQTALESKK